MKKILVVCFAFIASLSAMAQDVYERSFTIGVGPKVGVNMSSMTTPTGFNLNPKSAVGFEGGLMANAHFGRRSEFAQGGTGAFGVQAEALFAQRSIDTNGESIKLTGLNVPVLLQFYALPKLYIGVGPTFAATLSTSPDKIVEGSKTLNFKEVKPFDVMLTIGAGYQALSENSQSGVTFDVRYNLGSSKMDSSFDAKVSHFSVSIGYLFNVVR